MSDTRLICFEGMPGSGKSTTSQRLWLHLLRNGRDARWVYEHDTTHPIWTSKSTPRSSSRHTQPIGPGRPSRSLAAIGRRVGRCRADDGHGEGAISGADRLLAPAGCRQADDRGAPAEGRGNDRRAAPRADLHSHADVAKALRAICDERQSDQFEAALIERLAGTRYGRAHRVSDFLGLTDCFERFVAIADELFDRFEISKLAVDLAVGWPDCERTITDPPVARMQDPPTRSRARRVPRACKDARSDNESSGRGREGLCLAGPRASAPCINSKMLFMSNLLVWRSGSKESRTGSSRLSGWWATCPVSAPYGSEPRRKRNRGASHAPPLGRR